MDGSEIFSLLDSARKPTEFIGGVTSTSQSWVQVASCFLLGVPDSAHLPFFMPLGCVRACVCVLHPRGFALNASEVSLVIFLCVCLA